MLFENSLQNRKEREYLDNIGVEYLVAKGQLCTRAVHHVLNVTRALLQPRCCETEAAISYNLHRRLLSILLYSYLKLPS